MGYRWAGLLMLAACAGSPGKVSAPNAGLQERQLQFQGENYSFWIFAPSSYDGAQELPSVMLVHGAGGNGLDFLNIWRGFAEKNGIILVAPTVPYGIPFELNVVPQLYPKLMDSVRSEWSIDPRRIYLFGFSAGGYTVFDAGLPDSSYFAAGGVFAAVITPEFDFLIQPATRKIPIALYIGENDSVFSLSEAQRTVDLLRANGFSVRYSVFPNLGHDYGAVADQVNADVWQFFAQASLP
jgi:poly(3-hydroxybutyrate) depolymerase